MRKGAFDLEDMAEQLSQMQKLGGMGGVLGMLPGIGKIKKQLDAANLDEAILKRQQAIIGSMTRAERKNPKVLNASRKKRVAAGSGTAVQDINKLVKMHRQMADMMKSMGKKRGLLGSMFGGGPPPELPADLPSGAAPACLALPPLSPGAAPGLAAACRAVSPASQACRRGLSRACRDRRNAELWNITREGRDMSLKIRLARAGAKKRPYYRIVVADSKSPRDGRYIEKVGTYNPLLPRDSGDRVKLVKKRIEHWMGVGAQPTDRVLRFLDKAGMAKRDARSNPTKAQPGKKRVEREEAKVAAASREGQGRR